MTKDSDQQWRQTWVEVDLDAIRNNCAAMASAIEDAGLCAVVKADAYGHGAVEVAREAIAGGASWLAVALVEEGIKLRRAGIEAPILLLSEPHTGACEAVIEHNLTSTVYSLDYVEALHSAAARMGRQVDIHVKVDTGMHRVGVVPSKCLDLLDVLKLRSSLNLEGLWTHFAKADEPEAPTTRDQARVFDEVLAEVRVRGFAPRIVHVSNSAGALGFGEYRNLVRSGIAIYGVAPSPEVALPAGVRPAMSIHSRVSHVQRLEAGAKVSYGHRYEVPAPATIATIPIGYADGIPRLLSFRGGEVLIGGTRHPIAGAITMDQLMVNCGNHDVTRDDEVVLLGRQGSEEISAEELAERIDTIGYEFISQIGPRLPRRYLGGSMRGDGGP
jgi:alanine racemase